MAPSRCSRRARRLRVAHAGAGRGSHRVACHRSPPSAAAPAPQPPAAEPESRAPTYTVKRGDTLYQIALDHGLDYQELAAWNNLENPNMILVGQVLRVAAPGEPCRGRDRRHHDAARYGAAGQRGAARRRRDTGSRRRRGCRGRIRPAQRGQLQVVAEGSEGTLFGAGDARCRARAQAPAPERRRRWRRRPARPSPKRREPAPPAATEADDEDKLDWVWPAKGKVVIGFSETANLKGIDIAGAAGEPVIASAAGKVVYVGNGLRGYGKLVIVKHNKTCLSAYAHNREILVKEGQQVTQGPEDRGDGQHRRRPGEAAFRNPPAGQAGGSGALPSCRMTASGARRSRTRIARRAAAALAVGHVACRNAAGAGSTSIARSSVATSASRWRGAPISP